MRKDEIVAETQKKNHDLANELAERDVRILEFERAWWQHAGLKEQSIREEFGLFGARYYQILNRVIDEPAALAFDPMLIKRLRRLRDTRLAARSARLLPRGE